LRDFSYPESVYFTTHVSMIYFNVILSYAPKISKLSPRPMLGRLSLTVISLTAVVPWFKSSCHL